MVVVVAVVVVVVVAFAAVVVVAVVDHVDVVILVVVVLVVVVVDVAVVVVVVEDRVIGVLSSGVPWRAGPFENSNHSMSQTPSLSQTTGQQREKITLHMSMRGSPT